MTQPIRRGFADISTGQVHYRTMGEGRDLILLHMTNLSSRAFLKVMPLLKGFRCWAPDFPGFGQSDPLPGQPDMDAFARAIIEFMDQSGISQAHVFGLHAGNKVGATMAAHWPDRVGRLVLSGLTHSLITDQSKRMAAVPDFGRKLKETKKFSPDERNLNDWALLFGKLSKIWWRPSVAGNPDAGAAEINLLELYRSLAGSDGNGIQGEASPERSTADAWLQNLAERWGRDLEAVSLVDLCSKPGS